MGSSGNRDAIREEMERELKRREEERTGAGKERKGGKTAPLQSLSVSILGIAISEIYMPESLQKTSNPATIAALPNKQPHLMSHSARREKPRVYCMRLLPVVICTLYIVSAQNDHSQIERY